MQAAIRLLFDRPRAYAYPRFVRREGLVVEASEKLTRGCCHQREQSHATQATMITTKSSARERLGRQMIPRGETFEEMEKLVKFGLRLLEKHISKTLCCIRKMDRS